MRFLRFRAQKGGPIVRFLRFRPCVQKGGPIVRFLRFRAQKGGPIVRFCALCAKFQLMCGFNLNHSKKMVKFVQKIN